MTMTAFPVRMDRRLGLLTAGAFALAGCTTPLDLDFRGASGGFSTAEAVQHQQDTAGRPAPDDRGVISYPNYQVAIARRGDTLADVATRLDLPAAELARFNGIAPDDKLRDGEVLALPQRVSEPTPGTGAPLSATPLQPSTVDVASLAGSAINNAAPTPARAAPNPAAPTTAAKPSLPDTGSEPIRHKVTRGETAYTISRLYQVPVKSLGEWNGLGPEFEIREGQYLLIPVSRQPAPERTAILVPKPGVGSETPTPPSAKKPLPKDDTAEKPKAPETPVADVGKPTKKPAQAAMAFPVQGKIIRDYAKGRNEGIDISGTPGAPVKAADAGTVAAITKSAEGIPIIVIRHEDNLLTVYANITDVQVKKGDTVRRGQSIARLRGSDAAYVHFEVRKGFDSVDPNPYLS